MLATDTGATKFNTKVWLSDGTKFDFAEKGNGVKQDTGVCFSGGGTRSLSATTGQLRGLRELGLIDKIDYISCVSGGSWASALYTYYKTDPAGQNGPIDDDKFLGPVTAPGDIVVNKPGNPADNWLGYDGPERLGTTATNSLAKALLETVFEWWEDYLKTNNLSRWNPRNWKKPFAHLPWNQLWIAAVGKTFFKPFGLFELQNPFDPASVRQQPFFSKDDTTVAEIRARNRGNSIIDQARFDTVRNEEGKRPYLVVNACLIGPANRGPFNPEQPVAMEYTPLYVGSVYSPRGTTIDYGGTADDRLLVGGGTVEPFAYGGAKPTADPSECDPPDPRALCATVPIPADPFTVAEASGTSSSAFAGLIEEDPRRFIDHLHLKRLQKIVLKYLVGELLDHSRVDDGIRKLSPKADYWPPTAENGQDARRFAFGDGGVLENYGLIALLRRKVKNIVVFINTPVPLKVNYDPPTPPTAPNPPTGSDLDGGLPPLFGYPIQSTGTYTHNNQVFAKGEFAEVFNKLKAAKQNGKTMIAKCVHTVAENTWWGVDGVRLDSNGELPADTTVSPDQQVTILWVYSDRVEEWENQLPQTKFAAGDLGEVTLKEAIEKGNPSSGNPEGPFQKFPNYKTIGQNSEHELVELTPMQVNLLADLSCWCITNEATRKVFKDTLDPA